MVPPLVRIGFAAVLLCGCSSKSSSSTAADSGGPPPADDASTAGCTIQGGVCVPYTQACPPPQQNTDLCGDPILLCCLPEGGPILVMPEAGPMDSGPGPETGPGDAMPKDSAPGDATMD